MIGEQEQSEEEFKAKCREAVRRANNNGGDKKASLPADAKARKALPVATGVLDYFPDALTAVAELSRIGNDQHNPGQPLHWSKHKSSDHADCLVRHLIDRGTKDSDGVRHSVKVAWRALALLQIEIEAERAGLTVHEYLEHLATLATSVPGDWIAWKGGNFCPVPGATNVRVQFRNGSFDNNTAAYFRWFNETDSDRGNDIVAYRIEST
jgi:hypothetical protein